MCASTFLRHREGGLFPGMAEAPLWDLYLQQAHMAARDEGNLVPGMEGLEASLRGSDLVFGELDVPEYGQRTQVHSPPPAPLFRSPPIKSSRPQRNKHYRQRQKFELDSLEAEVHRHEAEGIELEKEAEKLQQRARVLAGLLKIRDEQLRLLKVNSTTSHVVPKELPAFRWACEVTVERLRTRWKDYLEQASQFLLDSQETKQDSIVLDDLESISQQVRLEYHSVAMRHPEVYAELTSINLESAEEEVPSVDYWRQLLPVIELSPGQRADIVMYHSVVQEVSDRLVEECQALWCAIEQGCEEGADAATLTRSSSHIPSVNRLLVLLQSLASLSLAVEVAVMSEVLTPVQYARLAIQSYPFFPKSHEILQEAMGCDAS